MKIRVVPVGCMPRGRYGSRIGQIRRTEMFARKNKRMSPPIPQTVVKGRKSI